MRYPTPVLAGLIGLVLSIDLLSPDLASAVTDGAALGASEATIVIASPGPVIYVPAPVVYAPEPVALYPIAPTAEARNAIRDDVRQRARDAAFDEREAGRQDRRVARDRAYQDREFRREERRRARSDPMDVNGNGTITDAERDRWNSRHRGSTNWLWRSN